MIGGCDMTVKNQTFKRRGAHIAPNNRFDKHQRFTDNDFLELCHKEDEWEGDDKTQFIEVFPKTIVNKVNSPDIGLGYSMNPYQGCEHGCIYCYARNSHEYWGYSAGSDFERKVLVKKNAADLLQQKFKSKSWKPTPIMLSGNTDCYQPAEARFKLTREILKVCLKHRHPVGIITKNALVLRDLDLLEELNYHQLVHVSVSITSLDDDLRKKLEPRTASVHRRLQTVRRLSACNIPVNVMLAPIIPGINGHELIPLVKKVGEAGAANINYLVVRLNGHNGVLFTHWLKQHFPDRQRKVLNQVKELHGGKVNDSRYGTRMKGEGTWAHEIKKQFEVAKSMYLQKKNYPGYNCSAFRRLDNDQLSLFE